MLGQRPLAFTSSVASHQAADKHPWMGAAQRLSFHHGIWECCPDPTPFPASFILNEEPCTASNSSASCSDGRSPTFGLPHCWTEKIALKAQPERGETS